jgi:hypothetical protein
VATNSISSTVLLFDFSGFEDEIETESDAQRFIFLLNTLTNFGLNRKGVTKKEGNF